MFPSCEVGEDGFLPWFAPALGMQKLDGYPEDAEMPVGSTSGDAPPVYVVIDPFDVGEELALEIGDIPR